MFGTLSRIVGVGAAAACAAAGLSGLALGASPPWALSSGAGRHVLAREALASSSIGVPAPRISVEPHRPNLSATPPGPGTCGCYEPAQFQAAYDLAPLAAKGDNGKGATIVIVDPLGSPTIKSDLATFDAGFKLPAPPSFKIITPDGPITSSDPRWALETSLDVEYAHAIAPGANILLVETTVAETEGAAGFPQIAQAENYVIKNEKALGITHGVVISQSFGTAEQTFGSNFKTEIPKYRSAFVAAQSAHVTVLAASGDLGVSDCANVGCSSVYTKRVNSWPSSDPLVTSVGGLQLSISTSSPYTQTAPPVVWNDSFPGAGGGGDSAVFSIPSFQKPVANVVGKWRGTPDVSMSASAATGGAEIYESAHGWVPAGGTDEATPEFAGIVAIADQVAGKGLGDLNAALYGMNSAHAKGIVDVVSGNNSFNGVTGYTAGAGYDMASGIGTVNAANFVPELVAEVAKVG
jgi:subtilase family serine protease